MNSIQAQKSETKGSDARQNAFVSGRKGGVRAWACGQSLGNNDSTSVLCWKAFLRRLASIGAAI